MHATRKLLCIVTLFAIGAWSPIVSAKVLTVEMKMNECWWGLHTRPRFVGMPFDAASNPYVFDLRADNNANQASPLMLSTRGRYIWCDEPFLFALTNGTMTFTANAEIELIEAGESLADAFRAAQKEHFPPSGKTPPEIFITAPQYNSWIELTYNQNEKDLLRYAQNMHDLGFPPGVLMVDDTWQLDYGTWEFDPRRFSDPKGMCDKLHEMGFKVMLWICPFVSMDSPSYRLLYGKHGFLRSADDDYPLPVKWWNGQSAVLDLSNSVDRDWFDSVLAGLVKNFGVDGFKFDAGDTEYYRHRLARPAKDGFSAVDQNAAWSDLGLRYPYNEFRASWKHGGQPIVQRLCDKGHSWWDLGRLIPEMIGAGLLGHAFVCPDMIGGGLWTDFLPGGKFEPELFVRSAQVHALCPMMQFSADPSRVVEGEYLNAVKKAVKIRQKFVIYLKRVLVESGRTGLPMLRSMDFVFPGCGYERCCDQFMLGDELLVAPQLVKGANERKVLIPIGKWTADDGTVFVGPAEINVKTPLDRLPYFVNEHF